MKKIGPILAILSGTITLVFAILGILVTKGTINEISFFKVMNDQNKIETAIVAVYSVSAVVGAIQLLLGIFALKKARGIAAILLFITFAISIALNVYGGIKANLWPTSVIITITLSSIATTGMFAGFFARD